MRRVAVSVAKHAGLVAFGLVLGLGCLELALRATGWVFLLVRQGEAPALRQSHTYRILCLGESTTADMLFLGRESYPFQLQSILEQRAGGIGFHVINGGVPAATTDAILERLPADLERHRPDIVVTMMGINDGESVDPALQISGRLRTWKLIKMLYYSLRAPVAFVERAGPDPPPILMLGGRTAWERIIEGRHTDAAAFLRPLIELDKWAGIKSRAHGMMAVLSWQRGDGREGDRYYQRFVELERLIPRSKTRRNYQRLQRELADRRIPLVAVQYPGLPVEMLRQMVEAGPGVVLVDNEKTFQQAIRTRPVREIYRDLFGGTFGHMTPYANGLLAENVAREILGWVAEHRHTQGEERGHRPHAH